ncbi:MAG: cysteine desulfurase-like protein [Planctomycetes bacterium]|nr:cysteine desulfurase-like protein [Planctomycetota bacterium]
MLTPNLRSQFPALHLLRDGVTPVFLDGPAGTQVPQRVIDAIVHYLTHCNANHGGAFATSVESDRIIDDAHAAVADFLNAPSPDEIIFGNNMTSLTFHLSRSVAKVLKPGDEVMVTRLDHDANVSPWVLAARDAGATVRWISIRRDDCTLDLDSFRKQLSDKTKWVAVGLASNGVGTINDVATITREAKRAGAMVFVDAVHYAPHGPIDVQTIGCDLLACSAYKFFGPHVGILWGRRELLESLPCYKVRPSPMSLPGKWMTGTQNHEGLAGVAAAIAYLADLSPLPSGEGPGVSGRRERLRTAMTAIRDYEQRLSRHLLTGLVARTRFHVLGIRDVDRLNERVPTVSVTAENASPQQMAKYLASKHIYSWAGNSYALEVSEQLGLEPSGFLRLGLVHYNTVEEIDRLLAHLDAMPK